MSQWQVQSISEADSLTLLGDDALTLQDTVWDDLRISLNELPTFGFGSDPARLTWLTDFQLYEFSEGDSLQFSAQIPHTYKEGTDLKPHLHWTPHARGNEENGNTVAWKLDYTIVAPNGVFPASGTVDLSDVVDGTDHKHQVAQSATISGSGIVISSMIVGRLRRDSSGDTWATDTVGNRPAVLELDFHFEVNTLGSRQEYTK